MTRILDGLKRQFEIGDNIWVYGPQRCTIFGKIVDIVPKNKYGSGLPFCDHYPCEMDGVIDVYLDLFSKIQLNHMEVPCPTPTTQATE